MTRFPHAMRQALTIARRDLTAMVMTPTFLLFLLSPLLMIGFGVVGSLSASTAVSAGEGKQRIVAIASAQDAPLIAATDRQLRQLFRPGSRPELRIDVPERDPAAQARALFDSKDTEAPAVLYGPLERPQILRSRSALPEANYLAQLAEASLRAKRLGGPAPLSAPRIEVVGRADATASGKGQVAYFAALGIFFLTLMLSGQAVGALAEERSNKVIEVLAAAVPLESVFFGKLLGTFGSALIFVGFWGTLFANLPAIMPPDMAAGLDQLGAAVGPWFGPLFLAYFAMAYLLNSAVYLGLGAQTGSQRELQMLSLPVTVFMFAMLGLASYGAAHPESWIATVAEVFPFSSPLAMAARAANDPALWPHLLALAWQGLWVAITVGIAARLFRRGVLQSGSPKLRRRKATAVA
jgi:ABC-2 type transport system permease protein